MIIIYVVFVFASISVLYSGLFCSCSHDTCTISTGHMSLILINYQPVCNWIMPDSRKLLMGPWRLLKSLKLNGNLRTKWNLCNATIWQIKRFHKQTKLFRAGFLVSFSDYQFSNFGILVHIGFCSNDYLWKSFKFASLASERIEFMISVKINVYLSWDKHFNFIYLGATNGLSYTLKNIFKYDSLQVIISVIT